MQFSPALIVRYCGPTDDSGSHFRVHRAEAPRTVTVKAYRYGLSLQENIQEAALAFLAENYPAYPPEKLSDHVLEIGEQYVIPMPRSY